MPKEYKKKRLAEEWSLDTKPGKLGIKVEGSERVKTKKRIKKELDEICQQDNKKKSKD